MMEPPKDYSLNLEQNSGSLTSGKGITRRRFVQSSILGSTLAASLTGCSDAQENKVRTSDTDTPWPPDGAHISDRCKFTLRLIAGLTISELFSNDFYTVFKKAYDNYPDSGPDAWVTGAKERLDLVLKEIKKSKDNGTYKTFALKDLYASHWDAWKTKSGVPKLREKLEDAHEYMFVAPTDLPAGPSGIQQGEFRKECENFFGETQTVTGTKYRGFLTEFGSYTVQALYRKVLDGSFPIHHYHLINRAKQLGILRLHGEVKQAQRYHREWKKETNSAKKAKKKKKIDGLRLEMREYLNQVYSKRSDSPPMILDEEVLKGYCALFVGGDPPWKCVKSDNDDLQCEIIGGIPTAGTDICP